MDKCDLDWEQFCNNDYNQDNLSNHNQDVTTKSNITKPSELYISTQTKIVFLSHMINLNETFWKIPMVKYHDPIVGVIKKQMKFISLSEEDLQNMLKNIDKNMYSEQNIISRITQNDGRNSYKDIRKVSIGLCKKDITSYKCKKKGAFYNCFALILRLKIKGKFKEIHVKVFNTGKLEIPGIQDNQILEKVLSLLCDILESINKKSFTWDSSKIQTVLINSNFSCGFYIDRDKLFNRLKFHYKINSAYDPCSYPGIQCEFYYTFNNDKQLGTQPSYFSDTTKCLKVSFMIFRTGSILIVGKCNNTILNEIYEFIKNLLEIEYDNIKCSQQKENSLLPKKKKIRKKTIILHK